MKNNEIHEANQSDFLKNVSDALNFSITSFNNSTNGIFGSSTRLIPYLLLLIITDCDM